MAKKIFHSLIVILSLSTMLSSPGSTDEVSQDCDVFRRKAQECYDSNITERSPTESEISNYKKCLDMQLTANRPIKKCDDDRCFAICKEISQMLYNECRRVCNQPI